MEQYPLVTIVTPSFNQGRFIRATIESVLSQDYPRIEYIVMDGGSTDETASVVNGFKGRLQWISEKDRGQSHAINKGFAMANGQIVSWLNSDDIILPGSVSHAVRTLQKNPEAGAVYGEGYQIDIDGNVKSRFPPTVPFNLWKLVYLSDYILQQTVYFRKQALEAVGYLDESLHWGMDWDILIRLGKRFPLEYIPEYMGCLREYEAAKTFSGGGKRFQELARIMRQHGGRRYPPGYALYGLDTYSKIWCDWIARYSPRMLNGVSSRAQGFVSLLCRYLMERTIREAQGWYSDGWAGTKVQYMLPPGSGRLRIQGVQPDLGLRVHDQKLRIERNGVLIERAPLPIGEFELTIQCPPAAASAAETLTLKASRFLVAGKFGGDLRRLAYVLKKVEWI
ncbi:MAG: glycosyltransferase family 2 protein [Bryobacteraceae bacterium]